MQCKIKVQVTNAAVPDVIEVRGLVDLRSFPVEALTLYCIEKKNI